MRTRIKNWVIWMVCGAPLASADSAHALSEGRQILPPTLLPAHYELTLIPNAEALTFKGTVQITGDALAGGRQIVLNAKGLTLDDVRLDGQLTGTVELDEKLGRAAIRFPSAYSPGPHRLEIAYHGPITKGTIGFFAMDYDAPAGKRRTLATNFEPADARALLPCWDEPALKATFAISVIAPAD
jgi:aminopeptidase N